VRCDRWRKFPQQLFSVKRRTTSIIPKPEINVDKNIAVAQHDTYENSQGHRQLTADTSRCPLACVPHTKFPTSPSSSCLDSPSLPWRDLLVRCLVSNADDFSVSEWSLAVALSFLLVHCFLPPPPSTRSSSPALAKICGIRHCRGRRNLKIWPPCLRFQSENTTPVARIGDEEMPDAVEWIHAGPVDKEAANSQEKRKSSPAHIVQGYRFGGHSQAIATGKSQQGGGQWKERDPPDAGP